LHWASWPRFFEICRHHSFWAVQSATLPRSVDKTAVAVHYQLNSTTDALIDLKVRGRLGRFIPVCGWLKGFTGLRIGANSASPYSGGHALGVLHVLINLVEVEVLVDRCAIGIHHTHGFVVLGQGGNDAQQSGLIVGITLALTRHRLKHPIDPAHMEMHMPTLRGRAALGSAQRVMATNLEKPWATGPV